MTYREHSAQLARGLGHLAVTGSSRTLDADGLDVAVAGRREALELLRTVLADTTGISRDNTALVQWRSRASDRRRVEELEAHPVAVLSRTLAAHPSPRPRQAPSDTLASSTIGGAHQAWARAARHALLASHEWSTRPARSSPDPLFLLDLGRPLADHRHVPHDRPVTGVGQPPRLADPAAGP